MSKNNCVPLKFGKLKILLKYSDYSLKYETLQCEDVKPRSFAEFLNDMKNSGSRMFTKFKGQINCCFTHASLEPCVRQHCVSFVYEQPFTMQNVYIY